jgi:membrane-associated phospholipid phosphatase
VNDDVRLAVTAVCCLAATLALGAYVAHRPLTPLDVESIALRGIGQPLAVMFTRSGYWPALAAISIAVAVVELILRGGIAFAMVLAGIQLVSQAASDFTKEIFKRIRPDDWLYHRELGFSFPSGHATTAVVFYGGLLLFIWKTPLPPVLRVAVSLALAVWIAGIPWSRMALAAHYGTDVIGGLLFGATWFCLMLLLLRHLPIAHIST